LSQYAPANPMVDHGHWDLILNIKGLKKKISYYGMNWNIGFYDWNMDFDDSCRHQLIWLGLGHHRLWPASTTMIGIWTLVTLAKSGYYGRNWVNYRHKTSFGIFFFNKRELSGWYLLVKETMVVRHVILTKRETHVSVGREITRADDEEMWKDEKIQEKKIGTRWIFVSILIMIEPNKKKELTNDWILLLAYSSNII
jgi:hypothetical protein